MIVLSWRGGVAAVVRLVGRLRPWIDPVARRGSLYCYASILGLHLAFMAVLVWGSWLLGGTHALSDQRDFAFGTMLIELLVGTFLREGGALEELGWRAFGLPTLLRSGMAPLSASVLLGALWSVWHIPRDAIGPMQTLDVGDYWWNFSQFTAACLSLSILMTWCFHLTAGSALPALMIHGLYVHLSSFVSPTAGYRLAFDLRVPIYVGAALFAVIWTRGRLGQTDQQPQPSASPS